MAEFLDGTQAYQNNLRRTRILKEGQITTEMLDGSHIQKYFGTNEVALVGTNFAQIFSASDKYHGKLLLGMTEAAGRCKEIMADRFRWTLSGGNKEYPRITKVVCTDPKPGFNNGTFDIIVDKPYFNVSDVIIPEDNRVRCLVVTPDGSASRIIRPESGYGYRYTIKLVTDDPTAFVNPQYLSVGHEWSAVGSLVANESNQDRTGFHFYSVFESQGQVAQHAVGYSLTDKALRKIKNAKQMGERTCDVYTEGGNAVDYAKFTTALWVRDTQSNEVKPTFSWMSAFDAEMMNTLHQLKEDNLMFGRESSNNYSPEGYQILSSSGLREQLESGHVLPHNGTLDLPTMENWFDSIMLHRISEENSNIVLSCGYEFRKLFDKMIKEEAKSFTTIDTLYIRKGEDYRKLAFGAYFAQYLGFRVKISVVENPAYDNRDFSRKTLPTNPDRTIDSMRADILDFAYEGEQGTGMTTDNICMIYEADMNYHISHSGKWDAKSLTPITNGGTGIIGSAISGMSMHVEASSGLMVADVTRCGSIFYAD